ncbi:MAG: GNAT family N-acetyltransferase [Ilumatobacteraceae bacterium]
MTDRPSDDAIQPEVVSIGPSSGLRYVHLQARWAHQVEAIELACFPTAEPEDLYDEAAIQDLAADFPEGCFVGLDGDEPVANGFGVRTAFDFDHPQHNLEELLSANPTPSGHDPAGDWYYGTDIAVRPDYRRRGIGHELYDLRKGVCRTLNLRGIVAGGVIPGFADHKHEMTADEYVAAVRAGELYDRTLTFQIENGFEARCALANYLRDPAVDDFALLIVWRNPDYRADA